MYRDGKIVRMSFIQKLSQFIDFRVRKSRPSLVIIMKVNFIIYDRKKKSLETKTPYEFISNNRTDFRDALTLSKSCVVT